MTTPSFEDDPPLAPGCDDGGRGRSWRLASSSLHWLKFLLPAQPLDRQKPPCWRSQGGTTRIPHSHVDRESNYGIGPIISPAGFHERGRWAINWGFPVFYSG